MFKQDVRVIFDDNRKELKLKEINNMSLKIKDRFFSSFDLKHMNTVHIFLPIFQNGEVNTWPIINELQKKNPFISIIVPKIANDELKHYNILPYTKYVVNQYNIMEPIDAMEFTKDHIDLAIIPLLGCDKFGNRVGYGKGYYDKFLKTINVGNKIGVSFFDPIYRIKDINLLDTKLDYCITPNELYRFCK